MTATKSAVDISSSKQVDPPAIQRRNQDFQVTRPQLPKVAASNQSKLVQSRGPVTPSSALSTNSAPCPSISQTIASQPVRQCATPDNRRVRSTDETVYHTPPIRPASVHNPPRGSIGALDAQRLGTRNVSPPREEPTQSIFSPSAPMDRRQSAKAERHAKQISISPQVTEFDGTYTVLEDKPAKPERARRHISISPQVSEVDGANTATYTMLPEKEADAEAEERRRQMRANRRASRRRSRQDGLDRERSLSNKDLSFFDEDHSHHLTFTDSSLIESPSSSHQMFPFRAAFFLRHSVSGEPTDDPPAESHESSCSNSAPRSRSSVSFSRKGRRTPEHPNRRRSSTGRRRKSMLKRRKSHHRSTSILDLPEGGYVRGSPFRRDRFADLGPCPTTKVKRIFCYNTFGDLEDPALVLINGMGSSCTLWPEDLCERFAEKGFFVVRFDNRDAGLTTHWDGFKSSAMFKAALANIFSSRAPDGPYSLRDMARDTLDLMDYIGIEKAHVLGVSMGGMIAQRVALMAPDRIRSLVLMSTHCPGDRSHSPSLKLILSNFLDSPKGNSVDAVVDFYIRRRQAIIGDYNADTPAAREMLRKTVIRSPGDGKAVRRQFWAIQAEDSQAKAVRSLSQLKHFPVGIIHGKKDELVPKGNAKALNQYWEGSNLLLLDKMGHVFAEELHETIVDFATAIMKKGKQD